MYNDPPLTLFKVGKVSKMTIIYSRRHRHEFVNDISNCSCIILFVISLFFQITEDEYVCEACRDLMFRVNVNLQQEVSGSDDQPCGPSHLSHTNVCLLCGCSTLHRQSDRILRDNPTELHQSMINIIESRVAPRQVCYNYEHSHTHHHACLPPG